MREEFKRNYAAYVVNKGGKASRLSKKVSHHILSLLITTNYYFYFYSARLTVMIAHLMT